MTIEKKLSADLDCTEAGGVVILPTPQGFIVDAEINAGGLQLDQLDTLVGLGSRWSGWSGKRGGEGSGTGCGKGGFGLSDRVQPRLGARDIGLRLDLKPVEGVG